MTPEELNKIEQDAQKLSSSNIKSGKEMESFNQLQGQLLNIQAERKNNLQEARTYFTAQNQNNQNIAQLGGIIASNEVVQGGGINPSTQAVLSKYGYNQPKTVTSRIKTRQVTPQNIIINNNTENKTTNNVTVPNQSVSPIVKSDNTNKFKVWLNNEFARQNEQAAIREREFNRREWSLSRSTNKLMEFMGDIGKSISENLNPQKISGVLNSEMKTLFFLMGFQYIATNWKKILTGVASIEKFFKGIGSYFGINKDQEGKFEIKNSPFVKGIKYLFGGKEDSSLPDVIKGFFSSGIDYLMERLDLFFKLRGEAVKSVKFPSNLNIDDPVEMFKKVGLYLGDILSVLVGGKDSLLKSVSNSLLRESTDHYKKNGKWQNKDSISEFDAYDKNTSYGDAVVSLGARKQNFIGDNELNSDGTLTNSTVATIKQSHAIGSMLSDTKSSSSNSLGIIGGFEKLNDRVKKSGTALVSPDFFDQLKPLGIDFDDIAKSIGTKSFKYVSVPKDVADKIYEGIDVGTAGVTAGVSQAIKNETGISTIDTVGRTGAGMATGAIAGSVIPGVGTLVGAGVGAGVGFLSDLILKSPVIQGLIASGNAKVKSGFSRDNRLVLVPWDAPGEPEEIPVYTRGSFNRWKTTKQSKFEFIELTPELMENIKYKIGSKLNLIKDGKNKFKFGFSDASSVKAFDEYITSARKQVLENALKGNSSEYVKSNIRKNLNNFSSDLNYNEHYGLIENYNKKAQEYENEFNESMKGNQFLQSMDNIGSAVRTSAATIEAVIRDLVNGRNISDVFGDLFEGRYAVKPPEIITDTERRNRIIKLIEFGKNELGLTDEQAAGFAGNFLRESQLVATARNDASGASGIAQWLGVRKRAFENTGDFSQKEKDDGWKYYDGPGAGKALADATFDEQLQFVKWEIDNIKSIGTNFKNKIKNSKNVSEAAANVFGYYEFAAGPKGAIQNMEEHGQDGWEALKLGVKYAHDAYATYKDHLKNKVPEKIAPGNKGAGPILLDSPKLSNPYEGEYRFNLIGDQFSNGFLYNNTTSNPVSYSNTSSVLPTSNSNSVAASLESSEPTSGILSKVSEISVDIKSQGSYMLALAESINNLAAVVSTSGNSYTFNTSPGIRTVNSMTALNNKSNITNS